MVEKHWHDTLSVQLGGDYNLLPERLTVRGGVFYETALAKPAYEHVDFVGGAQIGGTLGLSVLLGSFEVALAYELRHTPQVQASEQEAGVYQSAPGSQCEAPYTDTDLCHPQLLGQPSPVVNAGRYAADSNVLALDLLYRF